MPFHTKSPTAKKFVLRYSDGRTVTAPPHYRLPWILTQSDANRFIHAARVMHDDEIPEAVPISDFGVIQ